jgi:GTPase SAR1 family protein
MVRDEAYRIAEQKIEAARREGAKELDLSKELDNEKLDELPESIGQLTQLQSLNLSNNQLKTLPESIGQLTQLQSLNLSNNQLKTLPESIGQLTQLQSINLFNNQLTALPEWLGRLMQLQSLNLSGNKLTVLPKWLGQLTQLQSLYIMNNQISELPKSLGDLPNLNYLYLGNASGGNTFNELPVQLRQVKHIKSLWVGRCNLRILPDWLGELSELETLKFFNNRLIDLPPSLAQLEHLTELDLDNNPLNPELAAAYKEGLPAVMAYLRAKAAAQIILNEAKLILVGEGEVGKSCLLGALRGDPWEEGRPTTHGIEIKPVKVIDSDTKTEITLNGWDFGGQRVYRPTHQLFFSAPAVYLVVWKPREGPQQGFVKEWIKLVKHREPDAKILVVATHGGPQQRQPDIDRQELWDLFGKDTVLDFFHVESKPDKKDERRGIDELKLTIAQVASTLPEMGRSVPKRWQEVREVLAQTREAYLPLERVFEICRDHQMDNDEARLFITISHRLGHLIYYQHDPALRDIVVLKPDWLATAISFVLDDETTRKAHGLVRFSHLSQLWNDSTRKEEFRYPAALHPIFLRLMERFDLSYRVAGLSPNDESDSASLIAQLVPDARPVKDLEREWPPEVAAGDIQQAQICRIVDQKGQSAPAEGLFYQLIVRLHKYSLGRMNYNDSIHWQRGLVLDDDYNGRALLEHKGNDVHITVRAPYPERFQAMLTAEVKYLVESFWEGLRCEVMVPCLNQKPCIGLFEVGKLIENKKRGRPEQPCPVCNEWQNIDWLLRNAPAAKPATTIELLTNLEVLNELRGLRHLLVSRYDKTMGRFDSLDASQRELLSKADESYTNLLQVLTDEAKEGPRLFSLVPVNRSNFNPREWTSAKFCLTLWCEHSRLPLPSINGKDSKKGVYEIELTREWFKKAVPFLKVLTGTLSLVLPVASSGIKLTLDDTAYKAIEDQLDFGKAIIDASLDAGEKVVGWLGGSSDNTILAQGEAIHGQGATLRELHALLKAKDAGFGGLVRVMNKRQEFLWVHPQFETEY